MTSLQPLPRLLRLLTLIACLASASAFAGHPTMGVAQHYLHEAADWLNKSKTSHDPIVEMQKAINALEQALHNKKGHREAAVPIIEKAITQVKAGNRIGADKTVDEALAEIGKAVGGGHKNLAKRK